MEITKTCNSKPYFRLNQSNLLYVKVILEQSANEMN